MGYLYVTIGAICYGLLSSIVKITYSHGLHANEVTLYQILIAWVLLLIYYIYKKIKNRKEHISLVDKKQFFTLIALGTTTGLTGIAYYITLSYVDAGLAIILLFQFTWISFVIEFILFKIKPSKYQLISLIPIFAGTIVATNILGNSSSHFNFLGIIFGLLSALSYSIFLITTSRASVKVPYYTRSLLMVTGGAILIMLVYNPFTTISINSFKVFIESYGFLLGFLGLFLSTIMFNKGGPMIGPTNTAILGTLELPTVLIASALIIGEPLTWYKIVGMLLIFLGILISNKIFSKKKVVNK